MIEIKNIKSNKLKTDCGISGRKLNKKQENLLKNYKQILITKALNKYKKIYFCETNKSPFQIIEKTLYFWFNISNQSTKVVYIKLNFNLNN